MRTQIKNLYDELQEDLNEYADMGIIPIKRLSGALRSMRDVLARLKAHILKQTFSSQQEEIAFFKKEKPLFVAEQLYSIDICILQTSKPCYDKTLIREFLTMELRQIEGYFKRYSFLYQYYQLESTDMDALFFVRGAFPKDVLVPEAHDLDPEFSTACDHAWARFMAYERLREWLLWELRNLDSGGGAVESRKGAEDMPPPVPPNGPGGLRWTGETINLVEIAYGIWLTGQLNNGQVSITEIVEFLERAFRVKIGKAHRRWQSIAGRKRLSYTKYLDECKGSIEKRVEEEWGK